MKPIHFFSIQSRLGLLHPPIGSDELNLGVELGGKEILSPDFKWEFANSKHNSYLLPEPEELTNEDFLVGAVSKYSDIATHIINSLNPECTPVFLGGDHSISLVSYLVISQIYPNKKLGGLMFDSHADLHLQATSPTGNLHGMWLRMCCDQFDNSKINQLITRKLNPKQIGFIGNLQTEPEEDRFIDQYQIPVTTLTTQANKLIDQFRQQFDHLHVSFDIDVFASQLAPATGTPNSQGLSKATVFPLLSELKKADSISFDLVEVNPSKEGREQTIKLAREVLLSTVG